MREFIYKDKRTEAGKNANPFISNVSPEFIADLVRKYVFPYAPVPYFISVTLTDKGYIATKSFIGGLYQAHDATIKFEDFKTTGDFAEIIAPKIEKHKEELFEKSYKNALKKQQKNMEM